MAQGHSVTVNATCCDYVQTLIENIRLSKLIKFSIIYIIHVEVKGGVEFCHSTRNASKIRHKMGNGVV